ncbi:MAG: GGDEF domain-containing protein [Pseudomonadota bacterium]
MRPDREQSLARAALDLMAECGVIPTPDNFELFYAHATGEVSAVSHAIGEMLAQKKPFTPEILQELRTRTRAAAAMEQVGEGMNSVIAGVMGRLNDAGRDAGHYSSRLSAATGELDADQSPDDLRKLVSNLLAATREMENRTSSLEKELQKSSDQVSDLRSKLEDVHKESLTDPLTGISNRKAFDNALAAAETAMSEGDDPVSVLLCDIDHFKKFNDNWGHQTGDQVLRLVASCLSENVKGRDTASRYGGEEFGVVLRGTALRDAMRIAEQIRHAVEARRLVKKSTGDVLGTITISIGVAQFAPGEKAETAVRRADSCLYGAKQNGRNLVISEKDPRMALLSTNAA